MKNRQNMLKQGNQLKASTAAKADPKFVNGQNLPMIQASLNQMADGQPNVIQQQMSNASTGKNGQQQVVIPNNGKQTTVMSQGSNMQVKRPSSGRRGISTTNADTVATQNVQFMSNQQTNMNQTGSIPQNVLHQSVPG